jgi:hypothetical protein
MKEVTVKLKSIEKQQYAACESHIASKVIYIPKMREQEKLFHTNGIRKRTGAATLISENLNFKLQTIKGNKEGHYIIMKGLIHQNKSCKYICIQHWSI